MKVTRASTYLPWIQLASTVFISVTHLLVITRFFSTLFSVQWISHVNLSFCFIWVHCGFIWVNLSSDGFMWVICWAYWNYSFHRVYLKYKILFMVIIVVNEPFRVGRIRIAGKLWNKRNWGKCNLEVCIYILTYWQKLSNN